MHGVYIQISLCVFGRVGSPQYGVLPKSTSSLDGFILSVARALCKRNWSVHRRKHVVLLLEWFQA